MQTKHYHNINWQSQFFVVEDKVMLHLHCEYKLSNIINRKLEQQFVEPFKITEQIECLTYCLDLPSAWKIHDVIFIAHLELTSSDDLYWQSKPTHLFSIMIDDADNHYKIERLIWKWVSCWGCDYITQYLIQWKGYELKHDVWYNIKNLREAEELVSEYEKCTAREQEAILL